MVTSKGHIARATTAPLIALAAKASQNGEFSNMPWNANDSFALEKENCCVYFNISG